MLGMSYIYKNSSCALLTMIVQFWLEKAHYNLAESCMPWDMGANMGMQVILSENGLGLTTL